MVSEEHVLTCVGEGPKGLTPDTLVFPDSHSLLLTQGVMILRIGACDPRRSDLCYRKYFPTVKLYCIRGSLVSLLTWFHTRQYISMKTWWRWHVVGTLQNDAVVVQWTTAPWRHERSLSLNGVQQRATWRSIAIAPSGNCTYSWFVFSTIIDFIS